MSLPFCMHVLCLCLKYMHANMVVHYSSVYGNLKVLENFNLKSLYKIFKLSDFQLTTFIVEIKFEISIYLPIFKLEKYKHTTGIYKIYLQNKQVNKHCR